MCQSLPSINLLEVMVSIATLRASCYAWQQLLLLFMEGDTYG